jgi:hypothetical protein
VARPRRVWMFHEQAGEQGLGIAPLPRGFLNEREIIEAIVGEDGIYFERAREKDAGGEGVLFLKRLIPQAENFSLLLDRVTTQDRLMRDPHILHGGGLHWCGSRDRGRGWSWRALCRAGVGEEGDTQHDAQEPGISVSFVRH